MAWVPLPRPILFFFNTTPKTARAEIQYNSPIKQASFWFVLNCPCLERKHVCMLATESPSINRPKENGPFEAFALSLFAPHRMNLF